MTDNQPTYEELVARLTRLEGQFDQDALKVDSIPFARLTRKLEQRWVPDETWLTLSQITPSNVESPTAATYLNGWATQATHRAAAFHKDRNRVYLQGTINSTAATAHPVFTLPAGYRPPATVYIPTVYIPSTSSDFLLAIIDVATTGNVRVYPAVGSGTAPFTNTMRWTSLEGISFTL